VLERTNARILNLAVDLGYSDDASFTRAFRSQPRACAAGGFDDSVQARRVAAAGVDRDASEALRHGHRFGRG
jgi:hypothetical protein